MKMVDCPACNVNSICCALCNDDRYIPEELATAWLATDFDWRHDVSVKLRLRKWYEKAKFEKTSEERWPEAWPRYGK